LLSADSRFFEFFFSGNDTGNEKKAIDNNFSGGFHFQKRLLTGLD